MKVSNAVIAIVLLVAAGAVQADALVLNSPTGVAVAKSGDMIVTQAGKNPAIVMSRDGKKVSEIGADRLENAAGVAVDAAGNIYVANPSKGEIAIFDSKGTFTSAAGELTNPQAVAVAPNGMIFVANTGKNEIAVFGSKGVEKPLFTIAKVSAGEGAPTDIKAPAGVAVANGKLYISDTGNGRILIATLPTEAGDLKATVITHFGMAPQAIAVAKDRIYTVTPNPLGVMVNGYTPAGKCFAKFACNNGQWFSPGGLTLSAKGEVIVTDRSSCRLYVTDENLSDPVPEVKPALDSATITWTTVSPSPSLIKWGTTETCDQTAGDAKPTTKHSVTLKGLKPSTRYYVHAFNPVETIPTTCEDKPKLALEIQSQSWHIFCQGYGREIPFATDHKAGMTDWIYTPTIILVYKNIKFPPGADGKAVPNRILDDKDITDLKGQFEKMRLFVWRHSHCKVNYDFTYIMVDEERDSPQLGDITDIVYKDMVGGLKAQKKDPKDFWYMIVAGCHGWYANYLAGPVGNPPYEMGSCYTGYGHNQPDGWWWFPTHEHGHLMHSWIMCSGLHYFGYPDAPQSLPGKFGENFSFLATDWEQMPPRNLLCLKKTRIGESVDSDGSGVPDDDKNVPMDKKRFGWTKDMKGNCLDHLMAGLRTPGSLANGYTDFEGKTHKFNTGELYWVDRKAAKSTPKMDGTFSEKEWTELSSVPAIYTPVDAKDLHAKLYLAWDDKNYYVCIKSNKPVVASIDLDAANNGWWHGRDNLRFTLTPAIGANKAVAGGPGIWDFLNDVINVNGPSGQFYQDAYKPGNTELTCASGKQGDWYIVQGAVPARPQVDIQPKLGGQFGIRVDLGPTVEKTSPAAFPAVAFWDGEDFVWDITCVK